MLGYKPPKVPKLPPQKEVKFEEKKAKLSRVLATTMRKAGLRQ